MNQVIAILEISSILCLVTMAAMLTFRFAGFPDLSVDAVFTLGAVVLAKSYVTGLPLALCFVLAIAAGALAGLVTATLSERLKINPLLASVLMLTVLYTVNLRILGRASQPLFDLAAHLPGGFFIFFSIAAVVVVLTYLFFSTELGCALRSVGASALFLTSVGRNVANYRTGIVMAAGSLVSLSGALMATRYGFADVSMGFGVVIIGIAALIIGERLAGRNSFTSQVVAIPLGILTYEVAAGFALSVGLEPTDVKLGTGVLAIALLASQHARGDDLVASAQRD